MANAKFSPSLSILALAGSTEAAKEAAFADLLRGVTSFLAHGSRNLIEDTRTALTEVKGQRAKRVASMVDSAYAAAVASFEANGRQRETADSAAAVIVRAAIDAYDAAETAADAARKAKAAESKAATEKAAKAAAKALRDAAKGVEPAKAAVTLADAIAMVRTACAAGDDSALDAVKELVELYFDAAVEA